MRKYKEIQDIMQEKNLDGILVSSKYNISYLTGFSGEGCFYVGKGRQIILTDSRYTTAAKEAAGEMGKKEEGGSVEVLEIHSAYEEPLSDLFAEDAVKRIGFEDDDILYGDFIKIQKVASERQKIEFIPLGGELSFLRAVKTEEETALLREAEHIGDIAFSHILGVIKPGITEQEIAAELAYVMQKNGATGLSFDTIAASGIHSSMPHATVTSKKIEQGDFLTMDFGCIYQGYCSDMTRTIVVGKASGEQKKIYKTVLDAQMAALDFMKAGYRGREIDAVARRLITDAGYGKCFGHGLGHSVGLYIHEEPRLSPREERVIQANMIETVEPGIYVEGFGGVRIEDMVVVTENGHVNLTHSPKELIEL